MRVVLLVFILTSIDLSFVLIAQDLIKNGSFEEYKECPNTVNKLYECIDWEDPSIGASPDYFNSCYGYNKYIGYTVGSPKNYCGNQSPRSGEAYAGIVLFTKDQDYYYREYIQTKLVKPLKKGELYLVSMYVSLSDSSSISSPTISFCLTKTSDLVYKIPYSILSCDCSINIKNVCLDNKEEWIQVSSEYRAIGGEEFLTIGLFKEDMSKAEFKRIKKRNIINDKGLHCYYYIDDVSVISLDSIEFTR